MLSSRMLSTIRFPLLVGLVLICALPAATTASASEGADLKYHNLKVNKILFLGNSITWHTPAPNIGWEGDWGMAASSRDKDFVHRVLAGIEAETGKKPQAKIKNIAAFEQKFETYDLQKELKEELAFGADLVIVAIGENVPQLTSEEMKGKYEARLTQLLQMLQEASHPVLVTRSSFWPEAIRDTILQSACRKVGGVYLDISALAKDEANFARSERDYSHAGVASHPGDRGMQALADALLAGLRGYRP